MSTGNRISLAVHVRGQRVRLLVSGQTVAARSAAGWSLLEVKSLLDPEVIVIG